MNNLEFLRDQLFDAASKARGYHIDKDLEKYRESRAKVEAILEQLRDLYKQDANGFDGKLFDQIRTAKICARIMTRANLDREAIERKQNSLVDAHASFLLESGMVNRGVRRHTGQRRIAQCYRCKVDLDSAADLVCVACRWIICGCGACGCGFTA